jgi:hypothetical protein
MHRALALARLLGYAVAIAAGPATEVLLARTP